MVAERQSVTNLAQTIKVHRRSWIVGVKEEVTELSLQEAKKLVEDCCKRSYLVFDTKTGEVISEITPKSAEITILPPKLAGGD